VANCPTKFTLCRICGLSCKDNKYFSCTLFILEYNITLVHLRWFTFNDIYFVQSNKAFKRVDIDKKKEEIDKMKTKYGINSEEKKWNCGDILW